MNSEGTIGFRAPLPVGGDGIYTGPDPEHDRIFAIGDQLLDSTVTGFALNPVSINDAGQLAIRIALESGRQLIVRADRDNAGDNVPY